MMKAQTPSKMVQWDISFSASFYTNGAAPTFRMDALRDALIALLPPGTGVGPVGALIEGPVMDAPSAAGRPR